MTTIEADVAGTKLGDLLRRAASGEDIVISSAGVPKARLVPIAETVSADQRQLGGLAGLGTVPDDFDDPLPDEVLILFEGR
jgi:prevent-host-death family protein